MKYKISVVTSTRADYGIMSPLIKKLSQNPKINLDLVVTGTHIKHEFGYTINEIEADKLKINEKIDILENNQSDINIIMSNCLLKFSNYFKKSNSDAVILLGDRFEIFAIAIAAYNCDIPIIHLHGGELTLGAKDDVYRHCITKLASLHFPSTEEYKNRIIQLGEDKNFVFNVGAMGVENITNTNLLDFESLKESLKINLNNKYCICTYHPETVENKNVAEKTKILLDFCSSKKGFDFIFTKSNIDNGGDIINKLLDDYSQKSKNIYSFKSLGLLRYLSAIKHSVCVIGNSSSGIIEAPSLNVPTVNIGNRQEGRIAANSVINCETNQESLDRAFNLAINFNRNNIFNPYGKGNTSKEIEKIIITLLENNKLSNKKKFFDIGCV